MFAYMLILYLCEFVGIGSECYLDRLHTIPIVFYFDTACLTSHEGIMITIGLDGDIVFCSMGDEVFDEEDREESGFFFDGGRR